MKDVCPMFPPKESMSSEIEIEIKTRRGITLVPRPSDDPQDPLVIIFLESNCLLKLLSITYKILITMVPPELAATAKVHESGHTVSRCIRRDCKLLGESTCFRSPGQSLP